MRKCNNIKLVKILILASVLIIHSAFAIKLGSLDPSFSEDGISDGWLLHDQTDVDPNHDVRNVDIVIDSQGRIIVAQSFNAEQGGSTLYFARVMRYSVQGDLDMSFASNGAWTSLFPVENNNKDNFELVLTPNNGIIMAYSKLFCTAQNDCNADIYVVNLDNNGSKLGDLFIKFDKGSTFDRHDDNFADLVYLPFLNKIAIAAEVERTTVGDTDFGVALIDINSNTGALSLDLSFSDDGKTECFFDQHSGVEDKDKATAITFDATVNSLIVGGNAFEGNGSMQIGENLAFCEFNLSGSLLNTWSSQVAGAVQSSDEKVFDMTMALDENNNSILYVAGREPAALYGGGVISLYKYYYDVFMQQWVRDVNFGNNTENYAYISFEMVFNGATDDESAELFVEKDGSILVVGTGYVSGKSQVVMAKFKPNGDIYKSWGVSEGKAVHLFQFGNFNIAHAVAQDPQSNEIYVAGTVTDTDQPNRLLGFIANMHNDGIFADGME